MARPKSFALTALLLVFATLALAETADKWGLIDNKPAAFNGYTLFAPLLQNVVYLIDMRGRVVHTWDNGLRPGNSVYLLPDGRLLRSTFLDGNKVFGGPPFGGGRIQILNWQGEVEWDYRLSDDTHYQHHDATPMPNGNVMALVWGYKSKQELIEAGRIPEQIKDDKFSPETVMEIKPTGATTGEVVWEWHLWDHLVQDYDRTKDNYGIVADHPELLDLNCITNGNADWNHGNGIAYNAELDQVVIDLRSMNEFYVIDHGAPPPKKPPATAVDDRAKAATFSTAGAIRRCTTAATAKTRRSSGSTILTGLRRVFRAPATS